MHPPTAVIAGAGIGGLAAALALGRAGWRVGVLERAADPRAAGFAVNLAPNAIAALRELGVADAVIRAGHVTGRTELRTAGGRSLKRFDVAASTSRAPSVATLRSALHGVLLTATRREDLRLDELRDRDPIEAWGRGPVTLPGDAAHPMLPHTGQGAAQALEDAVALGPALASRTDIVRSLRRYEHVRARRTRAIVARGRRIARFTTTKSRLVGLVRSAAIRGMPARTMATAFLLSGRSDPHRALRSSVRARRAWRSLVPEHLGSSRFAPGGGRRDAERQMAIRCPGPAAGRKRRRDSGESVSPSHP